MSRKMVVGLLLVIGVIYYAILILLGFRTVDQAFDVLFDAVWWSTTGLAVHYFSNKPRLNK